MTTGSVLLRIVPAAFVFSAWVMASICYIYDMRNRALKTNKKMNPKVFIAVAVVIFTASV